MASQRGESSKTLAAPSPTLANEPRSSTNNRKDHRLRRNMSDCERKGIRQKPGYAKWTNKRGPVIRVWNPPFSAPWVLCYLIPLNTELLLVFTPLRKKKEIVSLLKHEIRQLWFRFHVLDWAFSLFLCLFLGGPSHNTHAALRFPWQLKLGFKARMSGSTVPGSFLFFSYTNSVPCA